MDRDRPGVGGARDHRLERRRLRPQGVDPSARRGVTQRALEGRAPQRRAPTVLDRVKAALVSSLGLGYAPFASGTFGTLGGVGMTLLIEALVARQPSIHFGAAAA